MVATFDANGAVQTNYTLAEGQVLGQTHGGISQYLLRDGQGNTRGLADTGGNVERYVYDAFGVIRSGPSTPHSTYVIHRSTV